MSFETAGCYSERQEHGMSVTRRHMLKGLSLGASGVLLSPFVQRLAAENAGRYEPKRFRVL